MLRADAHATALMSKDFNKCWKNIIKCNNDKIKKYTSVLDGCSGENDITNRWRNHFEQLYNRIPDTSMEDEFYDRICHDCAE